jgi:hypothetical protein
MPLSFCGSNYSGVEQPRREATGVVETSRTDYLRATDV